MQLVGDAGVDKGSKQRGYPQRGNRSCLSFASVHPPGVPVLFVEVGQNPLQEPGSLYPACKLQVADLIHVIRIQARWDDG
jgi:hypothetical protein